MASVAFDRRKVPMSRKGVVDLSILICTGVSHENDGCHQCQRQCQFHGPNHHLESCSTCTSTTASESFEKSPSSLHSLSSLEEEDKSSSPLSTVSARDSPLTIASTSTSTSSTGSEACECVSSMERLAMSTTSQVPPLALMRHEERATQLRLKRQSLEDWHTQLKAVTIRTPCHPKEEEIAPATPITSPSSTCSISTSRSSTSRSDSTRTSTEGRPKPPRFARTREWLERACHTNFRRSDNNNNNKEERQRCLRIVERLQQAKSTLQERCLELERCSSQLVDTRRKIHVNQERATIRLRLSQLDHALQYYQVRSSSTSKGSHGQAVPVEVLKVVSSLADVTKPTLQGHLNQCLASLCTQYPDEMRQATAMTKELRMIGVEKLGPMPGNVMPHFTLQSNHGEYFYSKLLSGKGRMVVLVYLGHWSTLCMATLQTWQEHYPALRHNSHGIAFPLIAIGTESVSACRTTAKKSGAAFPVLSDPQGATVLDPLGLVIRQDSLPIHPMTAMQRLSHGTNDNEHLPMTATLVVDVNNMVILYSHVSIDMANRAEPMDIISSFFLE